MSDPQGGSPIQVAIVVLLLVGGGWYFLNHYEIDGLDEVSVYPKGDLVDEDSFVSYRDAPAMIGATSTLASTDVSNRTDNPFQVEGPSSIQRPSQQPANRRRVYDSIKVASWALDGFGPTKLANPTARTHIARVARKFDIVALQQIASIERDLIPRLVEAINAGESRYDYVMGKSTGPTARQEQMAFIFDTTTVLVDRRHTYTVEDPSHQMMYDPLVASFRAAKPKSSEAWTFSLVNIRVDLARASSEVALLPGILESVRTDGRGEDDVVLLGLFQADDAYLVPTMGTATTNAAVRNRTTDIFERYQTSNVLIEGETTSEYLGRGGVFDYCREFNLTPIEAEAVTSHLPVFADFTAHEGGEL